MDRPLAATAGVAPASTRVRGNGYRWGQLVMGVLCMAMIANLQYGWTLFVKPMETKNHWGLSAIQLAFSIFVVVETWLVPVEGWLVDKFGPRPVVAGGGILAAIGWVINSYATTVPELYVAAVVSGVGAGCVYGTCVGNALKWFPDRRGLAAGLTAAGFGAGAAVTVIPIANMISSSGYEHTFFFFGLLQGAVIFVIALFMTRPTAPKGVPIPPRIVMSKVDYNAGQMMKTGTFWLTYVLFVAVGAGGLIATAQLGPIANDYGLAKLPVSILGISLPLLTMTLAIDNLANGFTRPLCGFISDHIGRENTMLLVFIGEGLALLGLMMFGHNPYLFMTVRRADVPVLGRDLFDLPGPVRGYVRRQECRGERRHAVHREGDGVAAGPARIGAVGRRQLERRLHLQRGHQHRGRHHREARARADASQADRGNERARRALRSFGGPAAAGPFRSCRCAAAGSTFRPTGSGGPPAASAGCDREGRGACARSAARVPAHRADAA